MKNSKKKYSIEDYNKRALKNECWNNVDTSLYGGWVNPRSKTRRQRQSAVDGKMEKIERLKAARLAGQIVEVQTEAVIERPVESCNEIIHSLEERLVDIRRRREFSNRVKGQHSEILDGFLYLVINPAWNGWVKIGRTTDYEKRLQAYQTSSPHNDYQMVEIHYTENTIKAENILLDSAVLAGYPVKGEWIQAKIVDLLQLMKL
jgi:hypothetical protein